MFFLKVLPADGIVTQEERRLRSGLRLKGSYQAPNEPKKIRPKLFTTNNIPEDI
jgi:hypothetical protein